MTNKNNNGLVICKSYLRDLVYNSLKKDKIETTCPICLELIECKHCFSVAHCGHYWHAFCGHNLNKCPICRS